MKPLSIRQHWADSIIRQAKEVEEHELKTFALLAPLFEQTSSPTFGLESVKVVTEKCFASLVVRSFVDLEHHRRLISVYEYHLGPKIFNGDAFNRPFSFSKKPVEPSSQVSVITRGTGIIPNQLRRANCGDKHTSYLPDDRILIAESRDSSGACQEIQENQNAVKPLKLCLPHIMVKSAPEKIEANLTYRGGRTPGGSPFGVEGAGVEGLVGIGVGVFAHRTIPKFEFIFIEIVLLCGYRKWALGRGGYWNTHHGCQITIYRMTCGVFIKMSLPYIGGAQ
ncbi:hypothetical protein K7H20_02705 [Salipiger manganoxidans]|uniref:hypothetical protein n=1 Tax=Salipiger marinus TaxID=555512 RepID=UPI001E4ABF8C|nr:hypothetical protein [Salipiger manganoxidans]MCD1616950.1 hypothetical protein [Salipiger manganoxidans]